VSQPGHAVRPGAAICHRTPVADVVPSGSRLGARDPSGLVAEVLIEEDALQARVRELGAAITRDYADREPILVCVLKGAFVFLGDLARAIDLPLEIDFMAISSYGSGVQSSGVVRILKDLDTPLAGRDVIVVEDIVDSGLTLSYLLRNLSARGPRSLEVCALLTKPERREADVECRYVGFEIANRFVVGYGLDYDERFRNAPVIGVVDESRL
jgi:hypoxanthine phosphoribosyltransferase